MNRSRLLAYVLGLLAGLLLGSSLTLLALPHLGQLKMEDIKTPSPLYSGGRA